MCALLRTPGWLRAVTTGSLGNYPVTGFCVYPEAQKRACLGPEGFGKDLRERVDWWGVCLGFLEIKKVYEQFCIRVFLPCLLYTSDAADDPSKV